MFQIPAPLNLDPAKVDADFAFLIDAFRNVLIGFGSGDIADALPWGTSEPDTGSVVDERRLT